MNSVVDILLAEDNQDDIDLALHALRQEKLANSVFVVRDGEEALDFLFCRGAFADRNFSSPPRLIMLDLKLPKISGLDVLRAIRADERTRAIPVVVLTSSKEERDIIDGYRLGVNAYAQKPVDFEQFSETVRQIGMFWMLVNQAPPPGAFQIAKPLGANSLGA